MDNGELQSVSQGDKAPLGLSRVAAARFAEKWKDTVEEQQNDQSFWQDFFRDILGITDLQAAGIEFQKKVVKHNKGTIGKIDVFWKDTFLVEHKSAGKDLDAAETQAREYVVSLLPALRPPVVIVSDFARFRIVDILLNKSHEFLLADLPDNLSRIEAVLNHRVEQATHVQVEADQKAAKLMADLYVQLEKFGYEGHDASVFLVRILFCLFADDTRMWKTDLFYNLVMDSNPLGTDLGPRLSSLFQTLNTPKEQRIGPRDPLTADFPYVNGGIFSERIETINFNSAMRNALMNACMYDWSSINPTIFGALFQNIKSKDERRANGEHYTTEQNIEKTILPLFIDELHSKLESAWDSESQLKALQAELGTYQILDPACGCGNFLITTYKKLRQLELDIIVRRKQLDGSRGQTSLIDVSDQLFVKLEQLHGIEYVEWSSQIAKVAIYLTDHQENLKLESVLGVAANRFPLSHSANIVQGNALQIDWSGVCPMGEKTMIVGNPPYVGARKLDDEQRLDQARIWGGIPGSLMTDYVTNWFIIAARFAHEFGVRFSFVSTNSITQGDQPALLWSILNTFDVKIDFAHRSFAWENDASGKAGVHCVIIGMSSNRLKRAKHLWHYADPKGQPIESRPKNINAYLIDYDSILVKASKETPRGYPPLLTGNEPRDGGYLSNISAEEAHSIRENDPVAAKYLRELIGGAEVLGKSEARFCLWLVDVDPIDMKQSEELLTRAAKVRKDRESAIGTKSAKAKTIDTPTLFARIAQPSKPFIAVPAVSSEKRTYVPLAFYQPTTIINNQVFFLESDDLALFMQIQSLPFTVWVRTVSSRLESRLRINASSVYNTFPFPEITEATKEKLRDLGHQVLAFREKYAHVSLGDLYDPEIMPVDLLKVHTAADKEILMAYNLNASATETEILEKLLSLYAARSSKPK